MTSDQFPSRIALRGMTPESKKIQAYDLTYGQVLERGMGAILRGEASHEDILVDEQAPDADLTLQGEVYPSTAEPWHLYLRYNDIPGIRMRQAFDIMKHVWGLRASHLLQSRMDAPSWEFLNDLFREYPKSIVEFTCYRYSLGHFKWNTIFWEVRDY